MLFFNILVIKKIQASLCKLEERVANIEVSKGIYETWKTGKTKISLVKLIP